MALGGPLDPLRVQIPNYTFLDGGLLARSGASERKSSTGTANRELHTSTRRASSRRSSPTRSSPPSAEPRTRFPTQDHGQSLRSAPDAAACCSRALWDRNWRLGLTLNARARDLARESLAMILGAVWISQSNRLRMTSVRISDSQRRTNVGKKCAATRYELGTSAGPFLASTGAIGNA